MADKIAYWISDWKGVIIYTCILLFCLLIIYIVIKPIKRIMLNTIIRLRGMARVCLSFTGMFNNNNITGHICIFDGCLMIISNGIAIAEYKYGYVMTINVHEDYIDVNINKDNIKILVNSEIEKQSVTDFLRGLQ